MRAVLLAMLLACSSREAPRTEAGRVVVVVTIDWEGAELDPAAFDALDELRGRLGAVPVTHFVSAAYLTKTGASAATARTIARAIRPGDELAVHLHAWRSLARAAGVEPRVSPSFLTGTDHVVDFPDGDAGFDTDLDTYDVPALRALLATSRRLLAQTGVRVSQSFRAGGYLATPKLLLALGDEGFAVDSSALDAHQLEGLEYEPFAKRVAEVWPKSAVTTQPFPVRGGGLQTLVELPIAAVADYTSTDDIVHAFDGAEARLRADPSRDELVVLAFHLETALDFADRIADAIARVRAQDPLARDLVYVTAEQAAERARFTLVP